MRVVVLIAEHFLARHELLLRMLHVLHRFVLHHDLLLLQAAIVLVDRVHGVRKLLLRLDPRRRRSVLQVQLLMARRIYFSG